MSYFQKKKKQNIPVFIILAYENYLASSSIKP